MRYEIATLSIRLGTAAKAQAGIASWTSAPDAAGQLLGCWTTEIGELNRILVLRGFADDAAMQAERQKILATTDPFGAGEAIVGLDFDGYRPFDFMPPVAPGHHGAVYEIRTYRLKHGGAEPTVAAWGTAMPARSRLSPLVAALVAIDGPPRITHIWPYADLNQRASIRAEAVAQGIWPPKGAPEWLTGEMSSQIGLPAAFSPLR